MLLYFTFINETSETNVLSLIKLLIYSRLSKQTPESADFNTKMVTILPPCSVTLTIYMLVRSTNYVLR